MIRSPDRRVPPLPADAPAEHPRAPGRRTGGERFLPFVLLASLGISTSCVERLLRIESSPAAAEVYVNGRRVGTTPVDVPFLHYGRYRVDAWAEGCEPTTTWVDVDAPWYQQPGIDLFAEVLDPFHHTDRHTVSLVLADRTEDHDPAIAPEEVAAATLESLEARAQSFRRDSR